MNDPYTNLAVEVCQHPEVLPGLEDWFNSDKPKSSFHFGQELGRKDENSVLAARMAAWLEAGRCEDLVTGYLRGLADRLGPLPREWGQRLDRAAESHPGYAVRLTLVADTSLAGFHRVSGLVDAPGVAPQLLHRFGYPPWPDVLGAAETAALLANLRRLADRDPTQPVWTALHLIAFWSDYGSKSLPEVLWDSMLDFADRALGLQVDASAWIVVPRLLAPHRPREVASALVAALTSEWRGRFSIEAESLELLQEVARRHPQTVMEEVGRRILAPEHRPFFDLLVLRGLFEAIGQEAVQAWVETHGADKVPSIARHLASPGVTDAGEPFIPPLTLWILTTFEDDDRTFRAFCAGRHQGVREGHARDRRPEIERQVAPFLSHAARRIREWAQYELKENDWEAQWDDQHDDAWERV